MKVIMKMSDKYGIKMYRPDIGWVWVTETKTSRFLKTSKTFRKEFDTVDEAKKCAVQTAGKCVVVKIGSKDESMYPGPENFTGSLM